MHRTTTDAMWRWFPLRVRVADPAWAKGRPTGETKPMTAWYLAAPVVRENCDHYAYR
jgi:hypothetical protein